MCQFLSALVFKNKVGGSRVFCAPEYTDSHLDLIMAKGLSAESDKSLHLRGWIRVELMPYVRDLDITPRRDDPSEYELTVDEAATPDWFDSAMRYEATEELRERVAAMIVRDDRTALLGGCWILTGLASVDRAINARVIAMYDRSDIRAVCGTSEIFWMRGNSHIGLVRDYCTVHSLLDEACINNAMFCARIGRMQDNSRINVMADQAFLFDMRGDSIVDKMAGWSNISMMNDRACVKLMRDFSSINSLRDSSIVSQMKDESRVFRKSSKARILDIFDRASVPSDEHEV